MARLWSVALRACLTGFAQLGIDVDEVCERSGISPEVLDDVEARIPVSVTNRIWPVAADLHGPGVGLHTGANVPFGPLQSLDYAIATADTVGGAIRSVVRYFILVTEGLTRIDLREGRGDEPVVLTYNGPIPLEVRDYALSIVAWRIGRIGAEVQRVTFVGPTVASRREYDDVFGCPVDFHAAENALYVTAESAQKPVGDLPGLRSVVLRELDRLLTSLDDGGVVADARNSIIALLPNGTPRLAEVASRLHMSPRTVQRRLRDNGYAFTELVDETRAKLAELHLGSSHLSVAEVGYLLGYAEPSSFTRAFSRWYDSTPAAFRAEMA